MQHVFASGFDGEEDDRSTDSGSDDDDISSGLNLLEDADGEGNPAFLPVAGYRIYNERPSILPTATSYRSADGYISFARLEGSSMRRRKEIAIRTLKFMVTNWSKILLVFVPLAIISPRLGCSDTVVFVLNCVAVIPLADVLCRATDAASSHLGETTGALLNVTMGNATEVAILHALLQRQYMIVRTSLLGSIIVNILLVLGLAMITGEIQQRGQTYNVLATRVAAGLLCLTTVSLLIPSSLSLSADHVDLDKNILNLGRVISVVLIIVYFTYLTTQIKFSEFAYKPLMQLDEDAINEPEVVQITEINPAWFHRRAHSLPTDGILTGADDDFALYGPGRNTASSPRLEKMYSAIRLVKKISWLQIALPVVGLLVSTGLISICGENLVNSIDHLVDHSPLSKTTIGLVILPVVGNAAELVSGIMFASRKQMDLAFAVSIGSAIQIALFVTPLMVIAGWIIDRDFALNFTVFEAVNLIASTVLFTSLVLDRRCSYLKGASLLAGYTIISFASYFIPNAK